MLTRRTARLTTQAMATWLAGGILASALWLMLALAFAAF